MGIGLYDNQPCNSPKGIHYRRIYEMAHQIEILHFLVIAFDTYLKLIHATDNRVGLGTLICRLQIVT